MVVELCFYELVTFMMIWSHLATMCVQPGFVPLCYKYQDEKLPVGFKIVLDKSIKSDNEDNKL